jgi:hypothetical protein
MPKETPIYTILHSSVHLHGRPRSKMPATGSAQNLQPKGLNPQSATTTFEKYPRGHTSHPQEMPDLDFFEPRMINASQTGSSDDLPLADEMASRPQLTKKAQRVTHERRSTEKSAYFGQDFFVKI